SSPKRTWVEWPSCLTTKASLPTIRPETFCVASSIHSPAGSTGFLSDKKERSVSRRSVLLGDGQPNQVQVITPAVIAQVFADCVCVAVASHDGGGPATAVTVTVTFCEGVKP